MNTTTDNIPVPEALKKIAGIAGKSLTTEQLFAIYDVISAVNMHGWLEGKEMAIKRYAPDGIYDILYPAQPAEEQKN